VLLHKCADLLTGQYVKVVDKPLGLVDNNKQSVSLLLETVNVLTFVALCRISACPDLERPIGSAQAFHATGS
jgi:hypothetical protein